MVFPVSLLYSRRALPLSAKHEMATVFPSSEIAGSNKCPALFIFSDFISDFAVKLKNEILYFKS